MSPSINCANNTFQTNKEPSKQCEKQTVNVCCISQHQDINNTLSSLWKIIPINTNTTYGSEKEYGKKHNGVARKIRGHQKRTKMAP